MLELIKIHIKVTLRLVNHNLLTSASKTYSQIPVLQLLSFSRIDQNCSKQIAPVTTYDKGIVTWINTQCSARNARMMSIRRFGIVCFTTLPKANDVNLACFR